MAEADPIPGDCRGMNFFESDAGLRQLLPHYLAPKALRHFLPHFARMGALAGSAIDELAAIADRNPPVLHARDRLGHDEDWIEYHPAYRDLERIAFEAFELPVMSHRPGVLGWPETVPPVAKYVFQYLFVQAEFGLMCPVSLTDTSIHLIRAHAEGETRDHLLGRLLADDPARRWKAAQFITEKTGGSDIGAVETVARSDGSTWRIEGDKWFCSHADADVALLLARPEGAAAGTAGLGLFALPRRRKDGTRNAYRILRLKDKLGTRSMASGEIRLEGAEAYPIGPLDRGFKAMLEQVNLSRLSHGVRAAAMMRRCLNEALAAANGRRAFGRRVADFPLMRRQLLKLMVPAEQALSMVLFAAAAMGEGRRDLLRVLTPLIKFRACRDNIAVATGAMEARGGNGYIEEWVTARLVRDAQIGVLWEGTSNIIALDLVGRAVGREGAHRALAQRLSEQLGGAGLPPAYRRRLGGALDRAFSLAEDVARDPGAEAEVRHAASALYHAVSAVLLAAEGARDPADARRALLSRFVLEHRLAPRDPLARAEAAWEAKAGELLLAGRPVALAEAAALLS
ncbi:MAG TPA: acyl-CoA dehydrogenase family protein [Stellaceae bacterium]|nr:acyl-CoA dehydrogenase family protein [Stellaceae bacterium]